MNYKTDYLTRDISHHSEAEQGFSDPVPGHSVAVARPAANASFETDKTERPVVAMAPGSCLFSTCLAPGTVALSMNGVHAMHSGSTSLYRDEETQDKEKRKAHRAMSGRMAGGEYAHPRTGVGLRERRDQKKRKALSVMNSHMTIRHHGSITEQRGSVEQQGSTLLRAVRSSRLNDQFSTQHWAVPVRLQWGISHYTFLQCTIASCNHYDEDGHKKKKKCKMLRATSSPMAIRKLHMLDLVVCGAGLCLHRVCRIAHSCDLSPFSSLSSSVMKVANGPREEKSEALPGM
ncbi:hypothetical protein BO70DRAFT_397281 [Aspergillus heteromorphus CBS 117.55]|uniref:Uncharacterized protein n=1 Tax=Aspergillus heteromorphus CBS 117.55 TaxID=1448321 RepID=A0A317VXZ9_9EURO|nr:uncharacterized protein BO70DRAFT_397281 [Aspergillus heteromorphus CBS 117.55]PWY79163.1 hypothetical protein BO70DRAFT_397281 [Aspergillus heteromorphus CBS 117.55]